MDAAQWDARYAGVDLVWTATPNQFLVTEVAGLTPGSAADLACGEGRNAVWLAEQGWVVTGVDFSPAGLNKAVRLAKARGVDVAWVESPVEAWVPPAGGLDLVAVFYLQLPEPQRTAALQVAASAVGPGGTLLVVAHDRDNPVHGFGGPPDPAVLYDVAGVVEVTEAAGLTVQRAEQAIRMVATDDGPRQAIDTVVRALRAQPSSR